jgi:hypothetical protein
LLVVAARSGVAKRPQICGKLTLRAILKLAMHGIKDTGLGINKLRGGEA